jgi:hypothetical protein
VSAEKVSNGVDARRQGETIKCRMKRNIPNQSKNLAARRF